jgi:hypothetical protein
MDVEKLEIPHMAHENKKQCSYFGKQVSNFS